MRFISYLCLICFFIAACKTPAPVVKPEETDKVVKHREAPTDPCAGWGVGMDSIQAVNYHVRYRMFLGEKDYETVLPFWEYCYKYAPAGSSLHFTDGIKICKHFYEKEKDKKWMNLMWELYDRRVDCFDKDQSYYMGKKGYDMYIYGMDDSLCLKAFEQSIELGKNDSRPYIIENAAAAAMRLLTSDRYSPEQVLKLDTTLQTILQYNISNNRDKDKYTAAKLNVDAYFSYLKEVEEPVVEEEPVIEEESLASLFKRARVARDAKNCSEALNLYEEILGKTSDAKLQSKCHYYMAFIELRCRKRYASVRTKAQKAIALQPDWAAPHLLIADAYVASSKACGPHGQLWVAMDEWSAIIRKFPNSSEAQQAQKRLNRYSQYLPTAEVCFMQGLKEGATYKLDCWIGKSTKVRFKK